MAFRNRIKKLLCCCMTADSAANNLIKKKQNEHRYCGCKESSKQWISKMKSGDVDRRTLVDNEVVEALEYDFISEAILEECILERPPVPFIHDLTSAFHPQSDLIIQGVINENATRFAINFVIGHNEVADIAFHFNPRMDQLYSARNSRFDGTWGHEEGNSQQKFPFNRGQPFYIEVYFTHSEFLVAVNGIHYCSYTYRAPLVSIMSIQVLGGVTLSRIHLQSSSHYPSSLPVDCPPCLYKFPLLVDSTTKNETEITPIYGLMQKNLNSDSEIEINGKVKLLPFSFYINLQEGYNIWPHPDIPLHMSVRFSQGGDHVILANSWITSGWGKEEVTRTKCLFTPGYQFTLRITCKDDAFIARVDDQPLLIFKHRVPYNSIDTLHIQGDVYIYNIKIRL